MNNVLIIDDDEVDFMIYSRVIKLGKFADKIIHQNSAESGLDYLKNISGSLNDWPTHILVDINMRGRTGFDFVNLYNDLFIPTKESTKIFVVSASDNERDKERARSIKSINGFITKPLTIEAAKKLFEQN